MPRGSKAPPGALSLAIAEILRAQMGRLDMSKTDLANRSGVQRTAASDIVRGIKQADIEQLESISEALGLDFVQVLHDATAAVKRDAGSEA